MCNAMNTMQCILVHCSVAQCIAGQCIAVPSHPKISLWVPSISGMLVYSISDEGGSLHTFCQGGEVSLCTLYKSK